MNADATDHREGACDSSAPHRHTSVIPVLLGIAILLLVVMVSADSEAEGETFSVDGVRYEIYSGSIVQISGVDYEQNGLILQEQISYNSKNYYVYAVKQSAFFNSTLISGSLKIHASIVLEKDCFNGCVNLTSLDLKGVTLKEGCFSNCSSLNKIAIQSGVKIMGDAFVDCIGVTDLEINQNSFTNWIDSPFSKINAANRITLCLSDSIDYLPDLMFSGLSEINLFYEGIGRGILQYMASPFENCKLLEEVEMSISLVEIDSRAFYGCLAIEKIVLPETLTSINDMAFANCSNLVDIFSALKS